MVDPIMIFGCMEHQYARDSYRPNDFEILIFSISLILIDDMLTENRFIPLCKLLSDQYPLFFLLAPYRDMI